jgi:hypothetical protein
VQRPGPPQRRNSWRKSSSRPPSRWLYDVEQLEVLPGPQGTLYGRSTLGGTVNVNFGDAFEEQLVHQQAARSLEESMAIGWRILRMLPASELTRLKRQQIARYIEEPAGA